MTNRSFIALGLAATLAAASAAQNSAAQPAPDPNAPANPAVKSPSDTASHPLAKGHNSFTKSQAQSRLEKAGYTDVTGLTLDQDGLWQAQASKNGQSIHVALDYKGDIAEQ